MSGSPFDAIALRHRARLLVQFGSTVSGHRHLDRFLAARAGR